ncbi:uncharacterized protein CTRU02_205179 [Colletotrichum truncatum]|uniref:Uncharacterized protein n=1 Tax=Colletotrichum truncatum TaxID=5467 RepID=A0ACC3Z3A8_COLTU
MALFLVPYNNAMRLGQGFNSYTQQICVDDAVVVNNDRAENILLNDGTTMRILAQSMAKCSAWTRQKEVVVENRYTGFGDLSHHPQLQEYPEMQADFNKTSVVIEQHQSQNVAESVTEESMSEKTELASCVCPQDGTCTVASTKDHKSADWHKPEARLASVNTAIMVADDEDQAILRRIENERLQEQREHRKEVEKEMRAENQKCREEAREERRKIREETRRFERECRMEMYRSINNATDDKGKALAMGKMLAMLKQNEFPRRLNGMGRDEHEYVFDASIMRGPSQTVTYTSRFVDRLSDITDDMCISGALSIKAAKIGGNGRGSFIDSDKFKESDLTFYISVKVVNQTINFKDALHFNDIQGVNKENFQKVYGDTFISGFLEGGEFNAVVSMKILDKAEKLDLQKEAKIAFTAGPMGPEAESNIAIARNKIESNTETTIQYENAQIYTNMLMESFMSYKTLYKQISDQMFQVRQKTMEIVPWEVKEASEVFEKVDSAQKSASSTSAVTVQAKTTESSTKKDGFYPYIEDNSPFEATIDGLDQARQAIRRQMARIVNEVDAIEVNPGIATDEDHCEPFQPPASFEMRIPVVTTPEILPHEKMPSMKQRIFNLMRRRVRLIFRRKSCGEQKSQ